MDEATRVPRAATPAEVASSRAAARDLDLNRDGLRDWVKRAWVDRAHGRTELTTAEREELARLRKGNRILQEERGRHRRAGSRGRSRANGAASGRIDLKDHSATLAYRWSLAAGSAAWKSIRSGA